MRIVAKNIDQGAVVDGVYMLRVEIEAVFFQFYGDFFLYDPQTGNGGEQSQRPAAGGFE